MIPCGWYPKMYFLVGGSSTVLCSLAGKYDAKRLHILLLRMNLDRRASVPDVASLLNTSVYMRYGISRGQARGIAQARKNNERKAAIETLCQSTTRVCSRLRSGTFKGAHLILNDNIN